MKKKTISLFTLMAFIIFSFSCATSTVKQMKVKTAVTAVEEKGREITILGVMKTSGEYILFSREWPGRISGNTIAGKTFDKQEFVSIPWSEVKYINIKETNPKKTENIIITGAILVGAAVAWFLYLGWAIKKGAGAAVGSFFK